MPLDVGFLREQRPYTDFHYFRSMGSTMTEASRLARDGAPHGTVVVAEEQTAGLGRMGRSWTSEPEVGIYCSVILRLSAAARPTADREFTAWRRYRRSYPERNGNRL